MTAVSPFARLVFKALPERMFGMKKYKNKCRMIVRLYMLITVCFLTVAPVRVAFAGAETLPFTPKEEMSPEWIKECTLATLEAKAIGDRWWRPILETVLDASVGVGNNVFNKVAKGAESLMIVGVGLWLVVFSLKTLGSMTESDPMDNMTKIGGMMLKAGFASALLNHRDFFFEYFVASVVQAGAGFVDAGTISAAVGGAPATEIEMSGAGLDSVKTALLAMADSIHDTIAGVMARAKYLQCAGIIHKFSISILGEWGPFQDPKIWASGCMIWLGALSFMVMFPFWLIDACFRLGVVAAMSPLCIAAWVCPATRDFTSKGFSMLLNVAFTFMMLRITMAIAVKMLTGATGLEDLGTSDESKTRAVCTFRWLHFGDKDACEGLKVPDTNSMWMYLVCVVYGWMLMKNNSSIAGHFAGATFADNMAFQAAKGAGRITENAGSLGLKVAGAAKDRIQKHGDRKAARIYEEDQRKRANAANGGPVYNPSKKEQDQLDWAKKRLRKTRVGALDSNGNETENLQKLLENGKTRTALRAGEKLKNNTIGRIWSSTKSNRMQDFSVTYQKRSQAELQKLAAVPTGKGNGTTATDQRNFTKAARANAAVTKVQNNVNRRTYANTTQGQNQRAYDQMTLDTMKKEAAYRNKVAQTAGYVNSPQGLRDQQDLIQEKQALRNMKQNTGVDDDILTKTF